ncbi:hypothetical protein PVK06_006999 [Gossypium arboreum]|uniref:Uncharacterized protein n=1 Tax=Gossypium arboreum TaxID=29729 RepID=A0ABR0QG42_GOSAR|nr:hypothetical protein PVK06_006999 [Gossypium arboreum]
MGYMRETFKVIEGHTTKLELRKDQFKEQVLGSTDANVEEMHKDLKFTYDKLTDRNDALEAMIVAFNEKIKVMASRIEELKGELVVCIVVVGAWMKDELVSLLGLG